MTPFVTCLTPLPDAIYLSRVFPQVDIGSDLSEKLTENADLMQYVFSLMAHKKTYMTACQFLEDMLQARRQVLNLNTIRESLSLSVMEISSLCACVRAVSKLYRPTSLIAGLFTAVGNGS